MKYFLTSDIHSFYVPLKTALDEVGFDVNNSEHVLVVLGDIFDRGKETKQVYQFLMSIPSERLVLIRGNHEDLFMKLIEKRFPATFDFSNGTVRSFCDIAGANYNSLFDIYDNWEEIKQKVIKSEEFALISDKTKWKDYFIIDNKYVCTHSFVPTYYGEKWEEDANESDWDEARWGCPYELHEKFWNVIGRGMTLVCGHWHTSDFHERYENVDEDYSIYRGETLIALDACTAYTYKTNVLVIDIDKTEK